MSGGRVEEVGLELARRGPPPRFARRLVDCVINRWTDNRMIGWAHSSISHASGSFRPAQSARSSHSSRSPRSAPISRRFPISPILAIDWGEIGLGLARGPPSSHSLPTLPALPNHPALPFLLTPLPVYHYATLTVFPKVPVLPFYNWLRTTLLPAISTNRPNNLSINQSVIIARNQ